MIVFSTLMADLVVDRKMDLLPFLEAGTGEFDREVAVLLVPLLKLIDANFDLMGVIISSPSKVSEVECLIEGTNEEEDATKVCLHFGFSCFLVIGVCIALSWSPSFPSIGTSIL